MSCPDCYNGAIHEGTPTGKVTKLHGLDTYVAEPASGNSPRGIAVIIPDAFGWDFVNIRLMADNYARKRDYRVYAPDFMRGHSAPVPMIGYLKAMTTKAETWGAWFSKPYHLLCVITGMLKFIIPNRFGRTYPVVRDWLSALRGAEASHLPIGVAGFCWGGKHVALLGADKDRGPGDLPLMDAGYTAHPSMLKWYDDIEAIKIPVSIAVGDDDRNMSVANADESRRILEGKPEGQKGEVRLYPGYGHGFACRIDPKNEDLKGPRESEDQALEWFDRHFSRVKY